MNEWEADIPSQFSSHALLGDAQRCLAFRCEVKRISHEENQKIRQKFNRHRSRLPLLDRTDRYTSAGASQYLDQQLAGLEPGGRRKITIFQPVGCISATTGEKFTHQLDLSSHRVIDFRAVRLEQMLIKAPRGTQQSLDDSVGKLRRGRPPNQGGIRCAMPMSFPRRSRTPNL